MKTTTHIIFSAIFSILLFPFIGWNTLIVFFSGFLFDIDHYFHYIKVTGDYSLRRCYAYYEKVTQRQNFEELHDIYLVFHSLEFIIILIAAAFFSSIALLVLLGVLLHVFLDYIHMLKTFGRVKIYNVPGFVGRRKKVKGTKTSSKK